jgi:hypothetical protein
MGEKLRHKLVEFGRGFDPAKGLRYFHVVALVIAFLIVSITFCTRSGL